MSSTPAVMNGDVGTTEVSADEYLKIGPWIAQLNHLAEQMKERAVRDFTECRSALMRVKQEMETLCEMKIDLTPLD